MTDQPRIAMHIPKGLKRRIEGAARAAKVPIREWMRQAAEAQLKRKKAA